MTSDELVRVASWARNLSDAEIARVAPGMRLKEPEGTLRVSIGGKPHSLVLGGKAPGGGDYYARHTESGEVYAIPAEIARNLELDAPYR